MAGREERYEDRPDYRRAEETVRGQLMERGVAIRDDDKGERLVELLEAVQDFERAVAEAGGDSMSNAPDSRDPDDPQLVLPRRADDESLSRYTGRVVRAAEAIRSR